MSEVRDQAYYADGGLQPIDFMRAKGWLEGYCLGSALKYMSRAGKKDPADRTKDLNKAIACIKIWAEELEKEDNG